MAFFRHYYPRRVFIRTNKEGKKVQVMQCNLCKVRKELGIVENEDDAHVTGALALVEHKRKCKSPF